MTDLSHAQADLLDLFKFSEAIGNRAMMIGEQHAASADELHDKGLIEPSPTVEGMFSLVHDE